MYVCISQAQGPVLNIEREHLQGPDGGSVRVLTADHMCVRVRKLYCRKLVGLMEASCCKDDVIQ